MLASGINVSITPGPKPVIIVTYTWVRLTAQGVKQEWFMLPATLPDTMPMAGGEARLLGQGNI